MSSADEQHFTVKQIAALWGCSRELIRRLFRNEPGVLRVNRPSTRIKRGYTTMKIPKSVMEQVHKRMAR
jgi:predicted RNA-binding protein with PIN domain